MAAPSPVYATSGSALPVFESGPLQVVSSLYRRHAWVVTGTPISSSLGELAGLCEFLAYHPYCDASVWKHLVHAPYSSHHAMGVTALRWAH